MTRMHSPEDNRLNALLDRGMSKQKAARIVAAEAGGEPELYDDWSDDELFAHAAELGVEGHAEMTRAELIAVLRDH